MIDIHSHILYGVDDGCKTIGDSINMIKEFITVGVTDLFLTPHFSFGRGFTISYKEIETRFNNLKIETLKAGLTINLYLGSEIDENATIIDNIKSNMYHSMNYTKYILIDFGTKKGDVDDICYELILMGYKPIIAHPERYMYIQGVDEIKKWKKTGALIQMNASSLYLDSNTKKKAKSMLKNKLVDIVSSDTHRGSKAIEYLRKSFLYINKKYGEEVATRMFVTEPGKLISNSNTYKI